MNINFTDKELHVIQLIDETKTPEEIVNIVSRDWFNSNSLRLQAQMKTPEDAVSDILAVQSAKIDKRVVL